MFKVPGLFNSWTGADVVISAGSGPTDAATVVQNFLNSLKGGQGISAQQASQGAQIFTTLPDLLPSSTTIPTIDSASEAQIDTLFQYLPPALQKESSVDSKKALLKQVLRSPQFHQSLGSLTMALRDGGLPSIADALEVKVQNGGLVRGGSVPLGGGDAVEAFVEGVKKFVEEKRTG